MTITRKNRKKIEYYKSKTVMKMRLNIFINRTRIQTDNILTLKTPIINGQRGVIRKQM